MNHCKSACKIVYKFIIHRRVDRDAREQQKLPSRVLEQTWERRNLPICLGSCYR